MADWFDFINNRHSNSFTGLTPENKNICNANIIIGWIIGFVGLVILVARFKKWTNE